MIGDFAMLSVSLKSGRFLLVMLLFGCVSVFCSAKVVLARGTPVSPKSLQIDDSKWTSGEAKQESGRYDDLIEKTKRSPVAPPERTANASPYEPGSEQANTASDTSSSSTSEGESRWVWGILATLCVVGGGLTCFGYYWSNMRRVTTW
jgi:hypothetical protein